MAIIKWRDSFNTGVEQFDGEHRKIVELIETMYQAMLNKVEKEEVLRACSELVDYAGYHFKHEEEAMAAAGYAAIDEHRTEHAKLREKAIKFQSTINERYPEGVTEFYHFLREWLIEHIQECDRKYGPFLQQGSQT